MSNKLKTDFQSAKLALLNEWDKQISQCEPLIAGIWDNKPHAELQSELDSIPYLAPLDAMHTGRDEVNQANTWMYVAIPLSMDVVNYIRCIGKQDPNKIYQLSHTQQLDFYYALQVNRDNSIKKWNPPQSISISHGVGGISAECAIDIGVALLLGNMFSGEDDRYVFMQVHTTTPICGTGSKKHTWCRAVRITQLTAYESASRQWRSSDKSRNTDRTLPKLTK